MAERVFIKVVGFTDVERHALNTVFRLSEESETAYTLWMPDAPQAPRLGLLDGHTAESHPEADALARDDVPLVWVGDGAPANAWRVFHRPIAWAEVVQTIEQRFAPAPLDFDLEFGGGDDVPPDAPDTQPSQLEEPRKRALIASADRDERLYWRAKLALSRLPLADEAATAEQLMELIRGTSYDVALIDHALPGGRGWELLRTLDEAEPKIPHVVVVKDGGTAFERARAWLPGPSVFFGKPPDPERMQKLLEKVAGPREPS
ncbi:response regulator [Ramlibacter sp.]|uniref:response regulator n=1 Tax=Ramlibacter sp. TaxID=1917967 RepID=UPI003D0B378A